MTKESFEIEAMVGFRFKGTMRQLMGYLKDLQESIDKQFKRKDWAL